MHNLHIFTLGGHIPGKVRRTRAVKEAKKIVVNAKHELHYEGKCFFLLERYLHSDNYL